MDYQPDVTVEQQAPAAEQSPSLIGFAEGVWHPEDLVRLEGSDWIVISAMRSIGERGALFAVRADALAPAVEILWRPQAEMGRTSFGAFDPHGVDARKVGADRWELLVVDHGGGEAIARLTIGLAPCGEPIVIDGTRIEQPAGTSGNAVAHMPDGGFMVTSMFDPDNPDLLDDFAAARTTGHVWRWNAASGWRRIGHALAGANGIALSADGSRIVVSEWAARKVWLLSADGEVLGSAEVDFLPDNLRWRQDGTLLLAGQNARPEAVFGCEARGEACPLAYSVAALDPSTMKITPIMTRSQSQAEAEGFGGATGALDVGDEVWVASFTGTRAARFACRPE